MSSLTRFGVLLYGGVDAPDSPTIGAVEIALSGECSGVSGGYVSHVYPSAAQVGISGDAVFVVAFAPGAAGIAMDGSGTPVFGTIVIPVPITISASISGAGVFRTESAFVRYYLTITGAADGLADVEIPMSSFQARRRSGDPTYLSAVIPSADYAGVIAARPNGTIRIDQGYAQGNEILQREPIMEAPITDAAVYQGGRQSSIVLTGYGTATHTAKAVTLTDATYRAVIGGKINYRLAKPYIFLNPGDTVTIEGDTFVIGTMSYAISPAQQQIELQEA